jgi:hypothetical protein
MGLASPLTRPSMASSSSSELAVSSSTQLLNNESSSGDGQGGSQVRAEGQLIGNLTVEPCIMYWEGFNTILFAFGVRAHPC